MAKTYKVKVTHRNHENIYEGTISHLVNDVFGYELECGHSWNSKIPVFPKTIKSLIKALNDSEEETRNGCFSRDYYELVS